jgi:ribonuclease VapC
VVVDSSALLAILLKEPEEFEFRESIVAARTCLISAATLLEASIVLSARKTGALEDLDEFIKEGRFSIEAVTRDQAMIAREAFMKYGKGRHPAALNFGDCFSYALAKSTGYPLLFKGADFSQTDIKLALTS